MVFWVGKKSGAHHNVITMWMRWTQPRSLKPNRPNPNVSNPTQYFESNPTSRTGDHFSEVEGFWIGSSSPRSSWIIAFHDEFAQASGTSHPTLSKGYWKRRSCRSSSKLKWRYQRNVQVLMNECSVFLASLFFFLFDNHLLSLFQPNSQIFTSNHPVLNRLVG